MATYNFLSGGTINLNGVLKRQISGGAVISILDDNTFRLTASGESDIYYFDAHTYQVNGVEATGTLVEFVESIEGVFSTGSGEFTGTLDDIDEGTLYKRFTVAEKEKLDDAATLDGEEELTNKTMSGANNTFSDIPVSAINTGDTQVFDPSVYVKRIISSNEKITNTGSTTENTIFTGTIPANSISANGSFHITGLWSANNNAGVKTVKILFNGTIISNFGMASAAAMSTYTIIRNRNSLSAQIGGNNGGTSTNSGFGNLSGLAVSTYSINTAADITVTITMQLATGTDSVNLEGFEIIAIP